MFRNDYQRARVCKALLDSLHMKNLWTAAGPTELAIDIWDKKGHGVWSHGEQIIWKIAWACWTGDDEPAVPFGEIIYTLDHARLDMVGTLIIAFNGGASALEHWLERWEKKEIAA